MKRYRFTEKRKNALKTAFSAIVTAIAMLLLCSADSIANLIF